MKKYLLLILAFSILGYYAFCQNVGIGTAIPNAKLEVNGSFAMTPPSFFAPGATISLSTSISTAVIDNNAPTAGDANNITLHFPPTEGQVLYITNNDNDDAIFSPIGTIITAGSTVHFIYLGTTWRVMATNTTSGAGWLLQGNAGTDAANDFIGTTDAQDLVLKANTTERLRLAQDGKITMFGDFVNQEITGVNINPNQTIAAGACCTYVPINGTTVSITIPDGNGTDNSGVYISAHSRIYGPTSFSATPGIGGFFFALYRAEDAAFTVNNTLVTYNAGIAGQRFGTSTMGFGTGASLSYIDNNLTQGMTYYYRLVLISNSVNVSAGQTFSVYETNISLLKIKR